MTNQPNILLITTNQQHYNTLGFANPKIHAPNLEVDPEERVNRWDDPDYAHVKAQVMHAFLNAELVREPTQMPRVSGS